MFKGLSNLGALIKQAQQIGGQMQNLSEELKGRRAQGTAGGGDSGCSKQYRRSCALHTLV